MYAVGNSSFESYYEGSIPWHPMMEIVVMLLVYLIVMLLVLLTVAFFTLFERKVIGLIHSRVGPNKVSFWGLLQPILDAVKLLTKAKLTPLESNYYMYNISPHFGLSFSLIMWLSVPSCSHSIIYSLIYFIVIGSILVIPVLMAGWSSNSKYSLIGSLRSVAQTISYEAVITTLIIIVCVLIYSYDLLSMQSFSSFLVMLIFPMWLFCTLAETHRAPFDFAESESELVSGYNTEYRGGYFAFTFLTEYSVLLVSCQVITFLFFGWLFSTYTIFRVLLCMLMSLFLLFFTIWIRVTYVRFRYDFLIIVAWKSFLPICLFVLGFRIWL